MSGIIKHTVSFYFVKGYDEFYKGKKNDLMNFYRRETSLNKLKENCIIPYKEKWIESKPLEDIAINDLGEIDTDLNIIFLPTIVSIFSIHVHFDHIFLFVSFPPSSYKCTGQRTYYSPLRLIRSGLTKGKPFDIIYRRIRRRSRNRKLLGTLAKTISLACSLDVVNPYMYTAFYREIVNNPKINKYTRKQIIRLLLLKRKLFYYYVTPKQLKERNLITFRYSGEDYGGIDTI